MHRNLIAILIAAAMLFMSVPGQVSAHESSATDLNDLAYDDVWPLLGPGGATEDLNLPGQAEAFGGEPVSDSCTHHNLTEDYQDFEGEDPEFIAEDAECDDSDVHTISNYQCRGKKGFDNPVDADINMTIDMPFFHSDLENGIFEATGSFFTDVSFEGEDADEVSQVWFGFAHTFAWPLSSSLCEPPFPMPGAYYEFYRGDTDGSDGWEIPVNTLLVPDAPYGAILRAMDSSGNTLVAGFVYSNVNNYNNDLEWQPGTPTACDQEGETAVLCPYHDVTPPNGITYAVSTTEERGEALSGDGPGCTDGFAVEYGEPLAHFEVLDGKTETEYDARDRDVDSVPLTTTARDDWGPGFCWEEPVQLPITFKAVDQSNNVRIQEITADDFE